MENSKIQANIQDDLYRYRRLGYGYIAKPYSKDEENKYYKEASKIVASRYGKFINEEEMYEILSNRGNIYTMVIRRGLSAFFESETGNIGVSHYLNRLSGLILHEMIHKVGFERKDRSFINMGTVFREAGTELVKSKSLSDKYGKEIIFNGIAARFPEKVNDYFLSVCLVNQLNEAVGGETLEQSILQGKDYFKPAIIKKYGEGPYIFLRENLEDISRFEERYWARKSSLSSEENYAIEEVLKEKIFKVQDTILENEFNQRIDKVQSLEDAKKFLNDLKNFGLTRVRQIQKDENGNLIFIDKGFKDYFENYKKQLENKFGNILIEYDETDWKKSCRQKERIWEVNDEEKEEIMHESLIFRDTHRRHGRISKLLHSIFGKKTETLDSGDEAKEVSVTNSVDSKSENDFYKVDINENYTLPKKEREEKIR